MILFLWSSPFQILKMNHSGLSVKEIDSKLNTIKLLITDSTDCNLLDLLLKCDLDIERAIGRYFGNTPSPPPQSNATNHSNHNSNNATNHNPSNQNQSNTNNPNSTNNADPSPSTSSVSPSPSLSPTLTHRRKKRPPNDSNPNEFEFEDSDVDFANSTESTSPSVDSLFLGQRPFKKRKLNQSEVQRITDNDSQSNTNTNTNTNRNTNSNNNVHSNTSNTANTANTENARSHSTRDPMDIDSPPPLPPNPKGLKHKKRPFAPLIVDRNWKEQSLGTLCLQYVDVYERAKSKGEAPPSSWMATPQNVKSLEDLMECDSFENIKFIAFSPFLDCDGLEHIDDDQHPLFKELRAYQERQEKEKEEERKKRIKQRKVWCHKMNEFMYFQRINSREFRASEFANLH